MRRLTELAAVTALLAALPGCGASAGSPAWHDGTAAAAGATSAGATSAPAPPPLVPGVVTTTYNRAQPMLSVVDPATGRTLMTRKLPRVAKQVWRAGQFTRDFGTVYWLTGSGRLTLHRADARGAGYAETATWKIPGTAGTVSSVVTHGRGGRLWVTYETKSGKWRNYSVAPGERGAPRREPDDLTMLDSAGRATRDRYISVAGRSWLGGIHDSTHELVYGVVQSEFVCVIPVSAWTLGCMGNGDLGTVATLTATRTGGAVRMKVVAPASGGSADSLVVSPDRKKFLYVTKGWWTVPVDGSAKPRRVFTNLELWPAVAIGWI